jgi:hypothetical protein
MIICKVIKWYLLREKPISAEKLYLKYADLSWSYEFSPYFDYHGKKWSINPAIQIKF